jgi:hypothetical protein
MNEMKILLIQALLLDESMDWIMHPGNDSAAFFRAKIQRRKKCCDDKFQSTEKKILVIHAI